MDIKGFTTLVEVFVNSAKSGRLGRGVRGSAEVERMAVLAEQLKDSLIKAEKDFLIRNDDTISFAPGGRCPVCGK